MWIQQKKHILKYSTPAFNGIFSILFIAAAACIIVDLLDIRNKTLLRHRCLSGLDPFIRAASCRGEVQEMPFYPDSGSVKIIGDTVVVKF